jgi:hypothetical protein
LKRKKVEISRNYFAMCKPTSNAIYFGEDVDIYEDGEIVSHEGNLIFDISIHDFDVEDNKRSKMKLQNG